MSKEQRITRREIGAGMIRTFRDK